MNATEKTETITKRSILLELSPEEARLLKLVAGRLNLLTVRNLIEQGYHTDTKDAEPAHKILCDVFYKLNDLNLSEK